MRENVGAAQQRPFERKHYWQKIVSRSMHYMPKDVLQVMKRSESRRAGSHPVLRDGHKWPHVTLHVAPSEAPAASLSGRDASALDTISAAIGELWLGAHTAQVRAAERRCSTPAFTS